MAFGLPVSESAKLDQIGLGLARAQQLAAAAWRDDDVERWLTDFPLPADFEWRGCRVLPRYRLKKGFGFWLRTTPYHQGLFELIRDILVALPAGAPMPTPEELAAKLQLIEREQGLLPLDPPPESETDREPAGNPSETQPEPNAYPS